MTARSYSFHVAATIHHAAPVFSSSTLTIVTLDLLTLGNRIGTVSQSMTAWVGGRQVMEATTAGSGVGGGNGGGGGVASGVVAVFEACVDGLVGA